MTFLAPLLGIVLSSPGTTVPLPLERLTAGNKRFVAGETIHPNQGLDRRSEVAKGQKPFAIVLTCADSRVSPEIVFDQGLGDLFVVRVAGNVVDPFTLASIEYAVEHLGSTLLVVLGHERCGAVKAALDFKPAFHEPHGKEPEHEGHIPNLLAEIAPAVSEARKWQGDLFENAIKANVLQTTKKVALKRPLSSMIESGKLTVIGAVYDLDSGLVKTVSQSKPKSGSSFVHVHHD